MKSSIRQAVIVVVAALAGGGAAVAIGTATTSSSTTTIQAAAPIPAANVSQTSSGISPAAIYRNDAPGVVLITATSTSSAPDPVDPFAPNQTQKSVAIGSGFVADAAGHVYTNAHVVLGASSVKVAFSNGDLLQRQGARRRQGDRRRGAPGRGRPGQRASPAAAGEPQLCPRRRSGRRDREPPERAEHDHLGHRLADQPYDRLARARTSRSIRPFRPTPRSTTATRAAR